METTEEYGEPWSQRKNIIFIFQHLACFYAKRVYYPAIHHSPENNFTKGRFILKEKAHVPLQHPPV
jgi:hypothetical protein